MNRPLDDLQEHYRRALREGDTAARYCSLSTVERGQPCSRTLVLREISAEGPLIFINDRSPKWSQLMSGKSELLLFWPSQMRQYRLRGDWRLLSHEQMSGHWQNKPEAAKLLDHYYRRLQAQSSELESERRLREGLAALREEFGGDIPFADNARGLRLHVNELEVWRAADDGLHPRQRYWQQDGQWHTQLLVP